MRSSFNVALDQQWHRKLGKQTQISEPSSPSYFIRGICWLGKHCRASCQEGNSAEMFHPMWSPEALWISPWDQGIYSPSLQECGMVGWGPGTEPFSGNFPGWQEGATSRLHSSLQTKPDGCAGFTEYTSKGSSEFQSFITSQHLVPSPGVLTFFIKDALDSIPQWTSCIDIWVSELFPRSPSSSSATLYPLMTKWACLVSGHRLAFTAGNYGPDKFSGWSSTHSVSYSFDLRTFPLQHLPTVRQFHFWIA